jgi:hypothetical protein
MLTAIARLRHAAVTPSRESEGMTAAWSIQLCYRIVAVSR